MCFLSEIWGCDVSDACSSDPCENGGSCVNVGASYKCHCTQEFYGKNCQIGNVKLLSSQAQISNASIELKFYKIKEVLHSGLVIHAVLHSLILIQEV